MVSKVNRQTVETTQMVRRVGSSAAIPRTNRLFIPVGFAMLLSYLSKGIGDAYLTVGQSNQGVGQQFALGFEHPASQDLSAVPSVYRDLYLGQNGALVVIFSHDMDRAAADLLCGGNDRLVHAFPIHAVPAVLGKKRGMDVDGGNRRGCGERSYPSRQDHEIWGEFFQKVMARFIIISIDVVHR